MEWLGVSPTIGRNELSARESDKMARNEPGRVPQSEDT